MTQDRDAMLKRFTAVVEEYNSGNWNEAHLLVEELIDIGSEMKAHLSAPVLTEGEREFINEARNDRHEHVRLLVQIVDRLNHTDPQQADTAAPVGINTTDASLPHIDCNHTPTESQTEATNDWYATNVASKDINTTDARVGDEILQRAHHRSTDNGYYGWHRRATDKEATPPQDSGAEAPAETARQ